jgi:hypothetical protein
MAGDSGLACSFAVASLRWYAQDEGKEKTIAKKRVADVLVGTRVAAGAEAQLTGRLTACAGSCGPGNLHLINGLSDCN